MLRGQGSSSRFVGRIDVFSRRFHSFPVWAEINLEDTRLLFVLTVSQFQTGFNVWNYLR